MFPFDDVIVDCLITCLFCKQHKKTRHPKYWPFVRGIHRWPMVPPIKGQLCGKHFHIITSAWKYCNISRKLNLGITLSCLALQCRHTEPMVSQITHLTIVYSTVYSGADQRKHQSSVTLSFVRGINRWPVNPPHKGPVTQKMFPFNDVIMWYKSIILQGHFIGTWAIVC